jgi:nucleotidyltransferase/DNA polymerase involved in DNA repair
VQQSAIRNRQSPIRRSLTSDLAVCVWIPLFPLRCEEQRRPDLANRPTAILSPDDSRRVWQVSSQARRMGVRPGVTVSQAIGLCPTLAVIEPDPVLYDEAFTRLLLALENVSPVVEPAELGRAYVGVDGLERLYGRPERVVAAIAAEAERQRGREAEDSASGWRGNRGGAASGVERRGGWAASLHLGWGRGKFVAWVAATRAKPGEFFLVSDEGRSPFLAEQPVAVLPIDPDTYRRLRQLGINTLGALAKLPETAVVSQFGREGRTAWRLASGIEDDPVLGRERPEPIVAGIDFASPVSDHLMLAYTIEKLVGRALKNPKRTGWRVHGVRAQAKLEQGASWLAESLLKEPTAEAPRIAAPLKTRLEQAPPTGAVERLLVEFTRFAPGTQELQLFARDAHAAARAGRTRALRSAAREIILRFNRKLLHQVIEVQPWSRIPERRYALIDYEP